MDETYSLPFERFWSWLTSHPNCIVRAGTPEAVLYDDEDLHWSFSAEGPGTLVVQVLRGKILLGEILLDPEHIAYVQASPPERDGEHPFELMSTGDDESFAAYFFVIAHGFDADDSSPGAAVH